MRYVIVNNIKFRLGENGNMKANKKFVEEKEAVSAVIGVILMVAITVAIAATVYVYVSGMLGPQTDETENASATIEGKEGYIRVTLTKVGDNYPSGGYAAADIHIYVNGTEVTSLPTTWESGQPLIIKGNAVPVTAWSVGSGGTNLPVCDYDVSVSVKGTAIGSGTAKVTAP